MNHLITLETCLWLAGLSHFGILSASALVPFVLDWKQALKSLTPFLRRLFWVYGAFIVLTIIGLGALTLLNLHALAGGDPVARTLAGFTAVFWGARLIVQLFVFDATPYLASIWLKVGNHVLTAVFIFFTATYAYAALRP